MKTYIGKGIYGHMEIQKKPEGDTWGGGGEGGEGRNERWSPNWKALRIAQRPVH
jgi:hypothetical protein